MRSAITLKRGVLVGAAVAVTAYAVWRRSRVPEVAIVRASPVRPPQPQPVAPEVVASPPPQQTPAAAHGQSRRRSLTHRGRHRQLSPVGWPKARPLARTRPAWPGATATR
jgi:hypothetical protein